MVVWYWGGGGGGGGGREEFVTFNPRRPFNFYWNNNSIILPKSVDLPQVSASIVDIVQRFRFVGKQCRVT